MLSPTDDSLEAKMTVAELSKCLIGIKDDPEPKGLPWQFIIVDPGLQTLGLWFVSSTEAGFPNKLQAMLARVLHVNEPTAIM
jgi:hypothetical protein